MATYHTGGHKYAQAAEIEFVWDGLGRFQATLAKWEGANLEKRLQAATKAYGQVVAAYAKDDAPVGTPSGTAIRLGAKPGDLKRAVGVRKAKKYRVGSIVNAKHSRSMFYAHFVIGGTKRGVKPNPFITRANDDNHNLAAEAAHISLQENPL